MTTLKLDLHEPQQPVECRVTLVSSIVVERLCCALKQKVTWCSSQLAVEVRGGGVLVLDIFDNFATQKCFAWQNTTIQGKLLMNLDQVLCSQVIMTKRVIFLFQEYRLGALPTSRQLTTQKGRWQLMILLMKTVKRSSSEMTVCGERFSFFN